MSTMPLQERTVGSFVADDYRTAAVFNAHGIDFCCKGGRSIVEVCRTKGLDPDALEREIRQATERESGASDDVQHWPLARLIEHIERVHHRFVRQPKHHPAAVSGQALRKICGHRNDRRME